MSKKDQFVNRPYIMSLEMREALERLAIPLAMYQFLQGKIRVLLVSDGLLALQPPGYTREELVAQFENDMYKNVHPDDTVHVAVAAMDFARTHGGIYDALYRERLYGREEYRILHARGTHCYLEDGTEYAVVFYDDVTEAIDTSHSHEKLYIHTLEELINSNGEAFAIVGAEGHELFMCNQEMRVLWPPVRFFDSGITFEEYFYPADDRNIIPLDDLADGPETIVPLPGGETEILLQVIRTLWKGQPAYLLRAALRDETFYDERTNLPNGNYFRLRGHVTAQRMMRDGRQPAVLDIRVRRMPSRNSRYDFSEDDDLMVRIANHIRQQFAGELVCRFGDERFVVLSATSGVEAVFADLKHQVMEQEKGDVLRIYAGICLDGGDEEEFLHACDRAKLAADFLRSSPERDCAYYAPEMEHKAELYDYIAAHIDEAVRREYIQVYYQPIIRTLTRTLCSFEALARWQDPQRGMLNPGLFISTLENTRQIHKLDCYMIRQICKDLRTCMDIGRPVVPVSVNLSWLDFLLCDIFDVVEEAMADYGLPRNLLHIEVTESLLAGEETVRQQIARFKAAGYAVWMDDFGNGYSSLHTLKDCDFDVLKLDMHFVTNLNERSQEIIRYTVAMAKRIGFETLAEGVESEEQLQVLREMGCEMVQGYFYGRPQALFSAFESIRQQGIEIEQTTDVPLFRELSRTDFLIDDGIAVVELRRARLHYLGANGYYTELLQLFGLEGLQAAEIVLNNGVMNWMGQLYEYCQEARSQGQVVSHNFLLKGNLCLLKIEFVGERSGRQYYRFMTHNATNNFSSCELSKFHPSSQYLIEMFQDIALVDVEQDSFEKVYSQKHWSGFEEALSLQAVVCMFAQQVIHPEDRERFVALMELDWLAQMEKREQRCLREFFRINLPAGGSRWVALNIIATESNKRFLFCIQELPQDRLADYFNYVYAQYERPAYHEVDELTELLNRTGFDRYAYEYLEQYSAAPAVLLVVDIDNLQFINDRYGCVVGDKAIRCVADDLKCLFGGDSIVGRNASDEFLVLIKEADWSQVESRVEMCAMGLHAFTFEGSEITVTLSIGAAVYPVHGANLPVLGRKADAALCQVKGQGKHSYLLFDAAVNSQLCTTQGLEDIAIMDGLPGAVLVYRATGQGEILYGNQGIVEMLECKDMEELLLFVQGSFRNLILPEDRDAVEKSIWNQIMHQEGSRIDFEAFRIVTRKGNVRYVHAIGRLVRNLQHGEVFYTFLYDDAQQRQLMDYQTMPYDAGIAMTLSQEFLTVYLLRLPEETFEILKLDDRHKAKVGRLLLDRPYREIVDGFINTIVCARDRKAVRQAMSTRYMFEQLCKAPYYSQIYLNDEQVYYEIKIALESRAGETMKVLIGFAECDEHSRREMYDRQIIQAIAQEYGLILELQLQEDKVERCLHRAENMALLNYPQFLAADGYSAGLIDFCQEAVKEKYREKMRNELSAQNLQRVLKKKHSIRGSFESRGGRYYEWKAVRIDMAESQVNHVLLALADKDEEIRRERANALEKRQSTDMIAGLAEEYAAVYLLDLHTGGLVPFRQESRLMEDVFPLRKGYSMAMQTFVEQRVYEPERLRVLSASSLEKVQGELEKKNTYSVIFSVWQEGMLWFRELKFVRMNQAGNPRQVVLGFLDRDDEIRLRYVNEQLVKEYSAIYVCELESGRIRGFLPFSYVKSQRLESRDYRTVIAPLASLVAPAYRQLWEQLSDPQYVQQLLMVDNRREYIYEVPGIDNTWRRVILQVTDRQADGRVSRIIMSFMAIDFKQAEQLALDRKVKQQKKKLETQHDQLALALRQANAASKAKTDFLSNMSHDIRTPMNAIIGFTELAEAHRDNLDLVHEYLQKISTASHHLLSLINDVLDMSRIESGKVTLEEKATNLPELVRGIRDILQNDMKQKGLDFFLDTEGVKNRMVICDKLRINQILLNCLSNAMKFTASGGSTGLRIVQMDNAPAGYGNFSFEVWDTGIGMSEEYVQHIFEPFTRERTSTVSKIQGTGLGMAIVKNIVDMMNGTISVYSEQGCGTTFHMELVLRLAEDAMEPLITKKERQLPEAGHFAGKTILVVEDNEINLEIILALLGDFGAELVSAENGALAVELYTKDPKRIDLILMDIQMPVMDGLEATKLIRKAEKEGHHVPILAMTANAFAEDRRVAMDSGMDDYITKPVDMPTLLLKLQEYLG
ncbi:MAG: EAL domain-containing protein [Selenomonas sp.]|uniref:EAL domain-containing protein n=1 Tax=Selenomonas sp. TaxID=2053611 RepID=UPI0025ED3725|nr:EAL domain-containing protein [Selenomonas sp.]MCR5439700.1 EAL domain-containing protein [Selenomonas sp.]